MKSAVVFRRVEFNEHLVRAFSYFDGSVKTELVDYQKEAAKEDINGMYILAIVLGGIFQRRSSCIRKILRPTSG